MPRFEAPSISITSTSVPACPSTHTAHLPQGSGPLRSRPRSARASKRAVVVLPTPRGPAHRGAHPMPTDRLDVRNHHYLSRATLGERRSHPPIQRPCTLLRTARTAISPRNLLRSGTPTAHERVALPLLPSGPGGVRRFSLRGAQPSAPLREAHSTPSTLEREFNPAEADCGLQGTANSPSSTATSQ